ncbi:MAG: B12-binding domain-containing radical SAM protein [Alphaproteobacteria bacterium]|nr:B12-binding domain-containing radical SAM protein [Alphaproteobacteria bacterium]MCB9795978.1 B12-binding domain-containing radical SAM protein [Alphaproteobacteria bacterium]
MRVLLVTPVNPITYQSIPDLGLGYLASFLRLAGHEVDIVDCVNRGWDHADLLAHCRRFHPDVVGFKAFYTDIPSIRESARRIREALPHVMLVVGGPHPSCVDGEEALSTFPSCHFCFQGEAEVGFPMLVDLHEPWARGEVEDAQLAGIPGMVWRAGSGEAVVNAGQYTDRLDDVMPAWDLLRPRDYNFSDTFYSKNTRVAPIIATRGCPLPCTFCAAHLTSGKPIRSRSVDSVIDEIVFLQEVHGVEEFSFIDDFFTGNKGFVKAFCREVIRRGVRFDWACWGVRLASLDAEMVRLMDEAGCYAFSVGVESGSPRILEHMAKHLTVDVVEKKLQLIADNSAIRVGGLFIIGYPEETEEDIELTIEFARRIPLFMATFYPFNPLPGTPIYKEMLANGELPEEPDWGTYGPEGFAYVPRHLDPARLRRLYRKAYVRFYTEPRRVRRLVRDFRDSGQLRFFMTRFQRRIIGSVVNEFRGIQGRSGSWERAAAARRVENAPAPSTLWPAL